MIFIYQQSGNLSLEKYKNEDYKRAQAQSIEFFVHQEILDF